jgi:hypothetical protein
LIDLELAGELSFDVNTIGFETAELDLLVLDDANDMEPDTIEGPAERAVCRNGETWVLGDHRITCLSALDMAS